MYPTPDDYTRSLDRLMAFLARYAHQNMVQLQYQPRAELMAWAEQVEWFLEQERREVEAARR